jgi:hypothetical protein
MKPWQAPGVRPVPIGGPNACPACAFSSPPSPSAPPNPPNPIPPPSATERFHEGSLLLPSHAHSPRDRGGGGGGGEGHGSHPRVNGPTPESTAPPQGQQVPETPRASHAACAHRGGVTLALRRVVALPQNPPPPSPPFPPPPPLATRPQRATRRRGQDRAPPGTLSPAAQAERAQPGLCGQPGTPARHEPLVASPAPRHATNPPWHRSTGSVVDLWCMACFTPPPRHPACRPATNEPSNPPGTGTVDGF